MKSFFQILFLFFFSFAAFAQEKKDTVVKSERKWNKGIFFSAGINSTQYYSDKSYNYLSNKTFSPVNGSPGYQSDYTVKDNVPSIFSHNKSSLSPVISLGLELGSSGFKKIKLNHIIFASYTQFSAKYSHATNYDEYWSANGTPARGWSANIKDTTQSKFSQTVFSLGYKLQPTFKYFFLSFGVNSFLNLIRDDQHKTNYISGSSYDEFAGTSSYFKSTTSDIVVNTHFINFPFELGAGGYIKIKKVILKPAFYFTYFMKGYNFYNASLGILYKFN